VQNRIILKMSEFLKPASVKEVNHILTEKGSSAHIIAGGTDLLVEARLKDDYFSGALVDISGINEIHQIIETDTSIEIGTAVTHDQIVKSPLINQHALVLSQACHQIGSQQIRNRGTIGGNICNASPCADSIPALFVLDARIFINSGKTETEIAITDFFISPYHTILKPDEWITKIRFKKMDANQQSAFIKLGRRNALSISRMNMAAVLELENEIITSVRFTPGSVFPVWKRITEVEELLTGKKISLELFEEAGQVTAEKMIEISGRRWSTPYKEPVVAALTERVFCKAAGIEYPELETIYGVD
jgi:CO/xanthine dehydrogenase FAD-binding subunit